MRSIVVFTLTLVASSAMAQRAPDEVVVVARALEPTGPWIHCGVVGVLGEVVFDVVRVEQGSFEPARFVAVFTCPDSRRIQGTLRLRLSSRRPRVGSVHPPQAPAELPRWYVQSAELAEAPSGLAAYLGQRRHVLARDYPVSRGAGGWSYYGDVVAAQIEDRRIVALRVTLPRAMTCAEAAAWMGYDEAGPALRRRDGCEWPGQSERHRLGPRVTGSVSSGVFEVRARASTGGSSGKTSAERRTERRRASRCPGGSGKSHRACTGGSRQPRR